MKVHSFQLKCPHWSGVKIRKRIQRDSFHSRRPSSRYLFDNNKRVKAEIWTSEQKLTKGKTFFISFGGTIFASLRDPNVRNSPGDGGFGELPMVAADSTTFRTGSKRALIDTLRGNWNPSVAIAIEARVWRNKIFICIVDDDKEQPHQVTFTPSIGRLTSSLTAYDYVIGRTFHLSWVIRCGGGLLSKWNEIPIFVSHVF